MYIADGHCDSIQKVDQGTQSLVNPYNFSTKYSQLQFVALFCCWPNEDYEACYVRASRYLDKFAQAIKKEADAVEHVRTYADIEAAFAKGKHAALLTVEGGSGIKGSVDIFREFYEAGVRIFGLAWLSNNLAESNRLTDGIDNGLTDVGREIIEEGNRLGMIFDASHLSDRSFWELAEISEKPIVATHSNLRSVCSASRNLTDEMFREIVREGGMIGLNIYPKFIGDTPERQTAEHLFDHLDYALSLGGEKCVGFGLDIDGVSGNYPAPIDESCSIHDRLIEIMLRRNYSESLVKAVAGENWLNFLRKHLR